ncbi:unnamed protein product [Enterobius vermicularis]|uniref:Large ribosomal subunit protein mL64 n=1 Tax=Enterobius vermicularis TaxID=51028 RepID=A0A0N4VD62_ENTVE|nr:unnamed protein product [Enterobius vermicularis]
MPETAISKSKSGSLTEEENASVSGLETQRTTNISRLRERHRLIAERRVPPVTYEWEKEKWGKRLRFGKYGLASGVSPAELWPSVEEIEEEEAFALYKTCSEVQRIVKDEAEARKVATTQRLKELADKEAVYAERLKKYETSLQKIVKQKTAEEEKMEKRILEIQEYFGYRIDPNDPRFEVMLAQKEAEEAKVAKEAKRQERLRKTVAAVAGEES